ncbi:MAG: PAS domain S-box protein [Polyangiaceae bacterium]
MVKDDADGGSGPNASKEGARVSQPVSEERFELLIQSVLDYGIFMLDITGVVASWNVGAERINGYRADEIIGQHFSVFYPQADIASGKCEAELATAEREGRFEEEGWRIRKGGELFWANVVISAVRTRTGELVGFGKVTRDLSERRRAEEELRSSEERLRLLIDSVQDYAIFILDPTGHVATWNPGATRLKGYEAAEIVGSHFSRFYPEEDILAGKCEMELEGATRLGRFEDEGWRIRKDGSRFWANVVITAIRNRDDALVGFAKVTRDLTERKQREEERLTLARTEEARRLAELNEERARSMAEVLREARDRAEEATRIKDEFLATVSHELRTPLNAILGWSRMLSGGTLEPDKATHAVEIIIRNALAQNHIIDDLLDVSRIIAGQLRLDVELVDVHSVINAAIDVVRPAADAKGIVLEAIPSSAVGAIRGDAGRLQQVLWNLLSNAVKFTPRGGRVSVSLERKDSAVEVAVSDTGNGIAPEFLRYVFDRFAQQEGSSSRKTGGLGLGLAIVKHLVELHGGTVEAHSKGIGAGSTFVLRLPVIAVRPSVSDPSAPFPSVENLDYPKELRGLHVLVLDDDKDARELVKVVLEQGGANVTLLGNAVEALQAIPLQRPDVIVSDIGMPGEDGYAFIQKLRQLPREMGGRTPAVALTAFARAEDRRKALLAGFQNHAAKPVEPQELLMVIANLAGRYG